MQATEDQKKMLRKIKLASPITDAARHTLVVGCLENGLSGAYVQFGSDVQTYGLWEALLFAEGYENDGHYSLGTAQRALNAAIAQTKG